MSSYEVDFSVLVVFPHLLYDFGGPVIGPHTYSSINYEDYFADTIYHIPCTCSGVATAAIDTRAIFPWPMQILVGSFLYIV